MKLKKNEKYGLFHIKEGLILPVQYELIRNIYSYDNYLFIEQKSKWGVFDINKLKITIPIKYSGIDKLKKAGEKCYFKITTTNGQDGYINEEGTEFFK